MKGRILPKEKIVEALEAIVVSGDKVVLEGDNQKQGMADQWHLAIRRWHADRAGAEHFTGASDIRRAAAEPGGAADAEQRVGLAQPYFANPANAVTPPPFTVGNAPREVATARVPGTSTSALSFFKQFAMPIREGSKLEFRAEAFNALNHPQFAGPNVTVGSSAFGKVTSQVNSPRQALKLYF